MNLSLNEIYRLFGKAPVKKDAWIKAVSTDSRTVKTGELFIAIKGPRIDGHEFIKDAVKKGAVEIIASSGKTGILVKDTTAAMLLLARYYAAKFKNAKIAAITGSNGKTTTKEMLAAMLCEALGKKRVLSSEKSFNNHIGVPLTVFKMKTGLRAGIFEMGMNNLGEISRLAAVLNIDTAVITNVGTSHIGRLKNTANIAKAKAEIFEGVAKGGRVVLNADDKYFNVLAKKAMSRGIKVISFGLGKNADVYAEVVKTGGSGTVFMLSADGRKEEMEMKLKGTHNVYNAAAAAAAALDMGAGIDDVKSALKKLTMGGSLRFDEKTIRGIRVIEDCYNANPDSFKAGLETLRSMDMHSLIIVSGDMLELGAASGKYHAVIGAMIARLGVRKLMVFGRYAGYVIKGYVKAGGSRHTASAYKNKKKMAADLKAFAKPGDTVYVKGSRGNKLEEVIESLK
jgi:UDP-N-acetylmuramoyl-tripeptide--D-alanyl-D-alanine ligase